MVFGLGKVPSGRQIFANLLITLLTIAVLKALGRNIPQLQTIPLVGVAFT